MRTKLRCTAAELTLYDPALRPAALMSPPYEGKPLALLPVLIKPCRKRYAKVGDKPLSPSLSFFQLSIHIRVASCTRLCIFDVFVSDMTDTNE